MNVDGYLQRVLFGIDITLHRVIKGEINIFKRIFKVKLSVEEDSN